MGTISKVGLKIWSFLDFFGAFWASRTPQNFLKKNKIVCNIKVDVWEEKCDISLKDRSISLKALIFFTPWPELFPVAWTMAYSVLAPFGASLRESTKSMEWEYPKSSWKMKRLFSKIQGSQVFIQAHCGKNTDPIQTQFQSKYRPFTDPQA